MGETSAIYLFRLTFVVSISLLVVDASRDSGIESRLTKVEILMERVLTHSKQADDRFEQTHDVLTKLISALLQKEVSVVKRQVLGSADDVETTINQLSLEDLRELLRGRDGRDGRDGDDGVDGEDGVDGADGQPGYHGPPGMNGRDGLPGPKGAVGSPGSSGAPAENTQGSVYTRWGRKTCPVTSTTVYEGLAAAHAYNSQGGGANFQCLPLSPQYNAYSGSGSKSIIAGTEYETGFNSAAHNQNVPCARCYSPRSAVMMTPARRDCPANWTKEYEGYLMSEYSGEPRNPTTYECVDDNPEYVSGHERNSDGALLYYVYPDCQAGGTVGYCPPYDSGKKLTCVVCTR